MNVNIFFLVRRQPVLGIGHTIVTLEYYNPQVICALLIRFIPAVIYLRCFTILQMKRLPMTAVYLWSMRINIEPYTHYIKCNIIIIK